MAQDKLVIFDTTMRDGEQSPGAAMTQAEKIRIAKALERLQVDVIEAGFPIASEGDFEAVQAVARAIKDSTICGLCRTGHADIDRAYEALKDAQSYRIHTFIGDLADPHGSEAQDVARRSLRRRGERGQAGAQLHRRRRIFDRGRQPFRFRFFCAASSKR